MSEDDMSRVQINLGGVAATVIAAFVVAGVAASINTTMQVVTLKEKVNALELRSDDRYTSREAASDRALINERLKRLEEWSTRLADRMMAVERVVRAD